MLPRICAGCHRALDFARDPEREVEAVLCQRCLQSFRILAPDGCSRCQEPLLATAAGEFCGRCTSNASQLESCTAAVVFKGAAEEWIRSFKYPAPGLAGLQPGPEAVAVSLVHDAVGLSRAPVPDVVIPIPLHPRRLRARGFNPSATLARAIARRLDLAFDFDTLVRKHDTPSQTRLDRRARRVNVRHAFACTRTSRDHVWLVDDVVTTGSTLEEAARTLGLAGTKTVHAICLARTA